MIGIQESLHQILACDSPRLGELFYPKFLSICPAAAAFFDGSNMQMQAHILVNSLQVVVALAEHNYPAAKSYLKILGHRHFQRHIPPEIYVPFRDSMLATLQEFHGDAWDGDLEHDWRRAFDAATEAMMQGYTPEPVFY